LVGTQLDEDLRAAGCSTLGPYSTLETATQGASISLAVLDINLNGHPVYPVADELSARGIPFIFLSGYIAPNLPERFRGSPQIAKPHDPAALLKEVQAAMPDAS
jgi:CheY-like chemotaxis protein